MARDNSSMWFKLHGHAALQRMSLLAVASGPQQCARFACDSKPNTNISGAGQRRHCRFDWLADVDNQPAIDRSLREFCFPCHQSRLTLLPWEWLCSAVPHTGSIRSPALVFQPRRSFAKERTPTDRQFLLNPCEEDAKFAHKCVKSL